MTNSEAKRFAHGIAWRWIECNMAVAGHISEGDSLADQARIDNALSDICSAHYAKSDDAYRPAEGAGGEIK